MSLNEPRWSVRAHQHRTMRAGEGGQKKIGVMVGRGASNLQGLASNTIWRETIQFAGTREEGKGREGQMRNRSRKINRSEVTDRGSASGFHRAR